MGKILNESQILTFWVLLCAALQNLYNALIMPQFTYCILCWGSVISENHYLHILQKKALRLIANSRYIPHTEPLCKELRVLKVFDMFDVAIWKFYYKLMHNDLPEYFSTVKPIPFQLCAGGMKLELLCSIFLLYTTHLPNILFGSPYQFIKQGYTLYDNNGNCGYRSIS